MAIETNTAKDKTLTCLYKERCKYKHAKPRVMIYYYNEDDPKNPLQNATADGWNINVKDNYAGCPDCVRWEKSINATVSQAVWLSHPQIQSCIDALEKLKYRDTNHKLALETLKKYL